MTTADKEQPRPRLTKLIVKNFRCIGQKPIEIELDDIVVLVGPNNVGKSSVLRAYQVVMSEGSNDGKLTIDDFPNGKIEQTKLPEIELHTIVYDNDSPGEEWIEVLETGEKLIREKWNWSGIGNPTRLGFNVSKGRWANDTDSEKVPWGMPNVANARRPQPHRISAFDSPEEQAKAIVDILLSIVKERVRTFKDTSKEDQQSEYHLLLENIKKIQKGIVLESQSEIDKVQDELTHYIEKIFPRHIIRFDARPEDDLDNTITLFKANPQLRMGLRDGYMSTIAAQGSGARRTLLWTALKLIKESPTVKPKTKAKSKGEEIPRPHVLLLDEPEICLHPSAIRNACDVLYDLPTSGNWQVMVTTHSPCFIDMSRDNTSIVRVGIDTIGEIIGTTIFRPKKAQLAEDDKERLKLLNICDPYVTEFFFGGNNIIVEGDTEYTAFKYVIAQYPDEYEDVHIIRARGKATIISVSKILNHFGSKYAVLHDSDAPIAIREGVGIANPAWTQNSSILETIEKSNAPVRLIASLPNFEKAYFNELARKEKPYKALENIKHNPDFLQTIKTLLDALLDHNKPLPNNCYQWKTEEELKSKYEEIVTHKDAS